MDTLATPGVGAGPRRQVVRMGVVLLLVLILGCATPSGRPVQQTLRVETPGCAQVSCELSNDRGRWALRTPGSVTITTSQGPLRLSCRSDEGVLATMGSTAATRPPSGQGAVVGGVVGGGVAGAAVGGVVMSVIPVLGAIVILGGVGAGAAAGQAAEAHQQAWRYPEQLTLPMACPVAPTPLPTSTFLAAPTSTAMPMPMPMPMPTSATATPPLPEGSFGFEARSLDAAAARAAGVSAASHAAAERGAVLISSVAPGSLAEKAGLRAGDLVLAADGHPLHDAAQLEQRLRTLAPGQTLLLRLLRQGAPLERTLWRAAAP